jgi:hypothetical protein
MIEVRGVTAFWMPSMLIFGVTACISTGAYHGWSWCLIGAGTVAARSFPLRIGPGLFDV